MQQRENGKLTIGTNAPAITAYSEEEFCAAVERLLRHKQSTIKFQSKLSSAIGTTFTGNYTLGRVGHNYFSKCIFSGASLASVAGAGSIFTMTDFIEADLSHSSFQSSTFEECSFQGCDLDGCNMSECYFQSVVWDACVRSTGNMSFSHFNNCRFLSTKPGNLAEAILEDVYMEDIRLTNMNLEFSAFVNISTRNVILPFSQLPYIFGGLKYLLETNDNVRVSSCIDGADSISVNEYVEALKDLEIFFSHQREFFPLANILMAFHRDQEALTAVLCGIQDSALQKDFRMCKYYCKLIADNGNFSEGVLKKLYDAICRATPVQELTKAQLYQYHKHIPGIRSMLIENPNQYPHAELRIETKLSNPYGQQITPLLHYLDRCLHLNGSPLTMPSISIRHNSPVVLVVSLCGTPLGILAVASLILNAVVKVCKAYNEVADSILKTQEIMQKKHETAQMKLEIRKLSAEVARLEQENPGLQQRITNAKKEITDSGIVIVRADFEAKDFDPHKWL